MSRLLLLLGMFFTLTCGYSQSDLQQIEETLNDYLEGTSLAKPEQIRKAFHEDLNLYSINSDGKLSIWKGAEYIAGFEGKDQSHRVGRIIQIDYENNAAIAKIEIRYPKNLSTSYIDYFMLLKVEGEWTIIHKMYTKNEK